MDLFTITSSLFGITGLTTGLYFWFKERLKQSIKHEYDKMLSEIEHNHKSKLSEIEHKYEIELTKLKAYIDNNSYKFQNNHLKRVDILEKLNASLHKLIYDFESLFNSSSFIKNNDLPKIMSTPI